LDKITTRRHFLYTPTVYDADQSFQPSTYSLFKHGCVQSTAFFADQLVEQVASLPELDDAVICSSAYMRVPNAAGLLLDKMMKSDSLNSVERIHLHRERIFPYDYAKLSQAEREQSMRDFPIQFDEEKIRNKTVIVIDDACVTGAHERAIRDHLAPYAKRLVFCYIVNLTAFTATTEHEMNAMRVKSLMDLLPIMNQPGFRINTRVRKTIFMASSEAFSLFTSCLSADQLDQILEVAVADRLDRLSADFRHKMDLLKGELVA
jgi:hypothetical protein